MPYSRVPMGASLLLLLAAAALAAAAAADSVQDPHYPTTARHWPVPPPPDAQQTEMAAFRHKEIRPCQCLNGGVCHTRLRVCQCPLGYEGARCERVDYALFEEIEAASAAARAHQKEKQREERRKEQEKAAAAAAKESSAQQHDVPLGVSVWIFYVPLLGAIVLLAAMARVLGMLGCTIWRGDEKKRPLLPTFRTYDASAKADNIYTLPLQPPPYSEKGAAAAAAATPFAHSTPCCTLQHPQHHLLQLQPEKLCLDGAIV